MLLLDSSGLSLARVIVILERSATHTHSSSKAPTVHSHSEHLHRSRKQRLIRVRLERTWPPVSDLTTRGVAQRSPGLTRSPGPRNVLSHTSCHPSSPSSDPFILSPSTNSDKKPVCLLDVTEYSTKYREEGPGPRYAKQVGGVLTDGGVASEEEGEEEDSRGW